MKWDEIIFIDRLCKCGCGDVVGEWKYRANRNQPIFKQGHNLNCRRKPEKWLNEKGYVVLFRKLSDGGPIFEHRYIMEQHLGRKISPSEDVHHKNGVKTDNRIKNLEVIDHQEHCLIHAKERGKKLKVLTEEDIENMLELRRKGISYRKIAVTFNVATMTVYKWVKPREAI
jgi:hypothetical protein